MTQPNSKPGPVHEKYLQSVKDQQAQTYQRLGWTAPTPSLPPQETPDGTTAVPAKKP